MSGGEPRVLVGGNGEGATALDERFAVDAVAGPASLLDAVEHGDPDAVVLAGDCAAGWVAEELPEQLPVVAVGPEPDGVRTVPDAEAAAEVVRSLLARAEGTRERDRLRRLRAVVGEVRDALLSADTDDAVADALVDLATGPYDVAWVARQRGDALIPVAARGIDVAYLGRVATDDALAADALDGEVAATVEGRRATLAVPAGDDRVLFLVGDRPAGIPDTERDLLASVGRTAGAVDEESTDRSAVTVLGDALAHELSNHLDVAELHLDLARERGDDAHFEHVETALDRMGSLRDEARRLAGGELSPEPVDVAAVANDAWATVDAPAATLKTASTTVEADPTLLALAVENLLRNAVEHGDESVTVRVGPREGGFFVADDGPGIPTSERESVLAWGEGDGSGVGLGIVALVCERHGWTVDVTESESGGARFDCYEDA